MRFQVTIKAGRRDCVERLDVLRNSPARDSVEPVALSGCEHCSQTRLNDGRGCRYRRVEGNLVGPHHRPEVLGLATQSVQVRTGVQTGMIR